ncbi:MAG: DUF2400 domain-containing protein [Bacteroidales bacterium]|nr:DUF2400 domain-containing protein [Bacteroidales bacterium]
MTEAIARQLIEWAETYNDPVYFQEDPIIFPKHFVEKGADTKDVEVAAIVAAHLAWGRRAMIVRDTKRVLDEMDWKPYDYIMKGRGTAADGSVIYRDDPVSAHRTIKWSELAAIFGRLRTYYEGSDSLQSLQVPQFRTVIFGQKEDRKAPDKKINMMRRWLVRDDGKVDLGVWKDIPKTSLIIPLDVHVYQQAVETGLTSRKSKDITTALEITDAMRELFPDDPCKGDFALFGYGVVNQSKKKQEEE